MTTESWGTALLVLGAVLVGAAIPVLVQLRATLRAMDETLRRSGARLDEALAATVVAAGRIDALVVRLQEGGRIEQLVDGVADVSRMVSQLRDTLRVASAVGAAVGPAVAAAIHAFREDREGVTPGPLQVAPVETRAVHAEPGKQAMP
ncbi:hypothetical protein [Anaeromyxobacter oryzae]|uniref:DUF948 domain-containing protein n=1 Tax=Anaeromyxobacter oryzae TaxID=2918170 RepID=A0ABM7WZ59_9BACT|nr:hypothetical protein [Anaeromyxobacter oryzae]BDG04762.1 hypothetical protein AMOR_37580 [Anaeromyxobacter oryzae]